MDEFTLYRISCQDCLRFIGRKIKTDSESEALSQVHSHLLEHPEHTVVFLPLRAFRILNKPTS
jgi:hypothetical protein